MTNWIKKLQNRSGQDVHIMTSWDDFGDYDDRLYDELLKHGIPAIFFVPVMELHNPKKLDLAKVISKDFTIGSHTINHPVLTAISHADMVCEVHYSKRMLEEMVDQEITHFCYPKGRYNKYVTEEVKKAGYTFARTVDVLDTNINQNLLQLHTTAHVYSGRREYEGNSWTTIATGLLDKVFDDGGYFHLWGHGKEINRDNEWLNLDKFLHYLREKMDYESFRP